MHTNMDFSAKRGLLKFLISAPALGISTGSIGADGRSAKALETSVVQAAIAIAGKDPAPLRLVVPNGCQPNVLPVVEHFKKATGISIELFEAPVDDINTRILLDALSNTQSFDLAIPATFGIPDLVQAKAIVPITRYIERYEPKGFRRNIMYRVGDEFDGEEYGFQTDGDVYTMFYNESFLDNPDEKKKYADLFGKALDVPRTWRELDRQIAFFHRPEEGMYGGLLFRTSAYLGWEWWIRFHAKGIWPFSPELVPQIDSSAGVTALKQMIDVSKYLLPEVKRLGLFENWARYSQGDIYCNIGWGGSQKFLNSKSSKIRGKMRYGMAPGDEVNGETAFTPYFNWGWNYVVTANSERPELAYLFALFASTPSMSTLSVRQQDGYFDPFRSEHYQDTSVKQAYSSEFLEVHKRSMRNAIPDLYLARQHEYFSSLNQGLQSAMDQIVSPEVAMQRISRRWNLISQRAGFRKQMQRWQALREKYPEIQKERLRDL